MFRPIEVYIGLRYTRARRRNHFISFISLFSIIGIALGVLVMITVLSVMNGFQKEVRDRLLGATSHATISGIDGRLQDWQDVIDKSRDHPQVVGLAPFVRAEAMLTNGGNVKPSFVRGIDPDREDEVSDIQNSLTSGSFKDLKPRSYNIFLGQYLAQSLGVRLGDKITMVTPQAAVTPAGILPRLKRFTVAGTFKTGHTQYDGNLAVVHIRDARKLMRLGDAVSGVRIKLKDLFKAPQVSVELVDKLSGGYLVSDWTRVHRNFFAAVETEKRIMFIILILIIIIAAFNIVSMMVMTVTEKQSDIAILRTLGSSPFKIMLTFITQGVVVGSFGIILGVILGVALSLNVETVVPAIEQLFGFKALNPGVYLISEVPSDLHWNDVIIISVSGFIITILASLYPAWRAANVQPAEALSYE